MVSQGNGNKDYVHERGMVSKAGALQDLRRCICGHRGRDMQVNPQLVFFARQLTPSQGT